MRLGDAKRHINWKDRVVMNILITGGAGYIGSELVQFLLPDHKVTVLDTLMYERDSLLRYVQNENFTFVKGDVRDTTLYSSLLKGADVVIPLAALVGFPLCDRKPVEAVQVNLDANVWLAQNKSPDQVVIYPCTNSGYGRSIDGSVVTEESPLNPVSLYGQTKVDAETAFRNADNCATFRLATVCGPSTRMRTDLLVNNFVLRALRDRLLVLYECEFMRNYVHIWDVCRSFKFLLDNWDECKNETYNLGHDEMNMNKLQLSQKIAEYLPLEIIKAEFTSDPDVRDYIVSSQKIYDKGFDCQYDLDTSIQQLIKTYALIDSPWYANY
jgi:nucleoside-diphosphate-sugar epimerase